MLHLTQLCLCSSALICRTRPPSLNLHQFHQVCIWPWLGESSKLISTRPNLSVYTSSVNWPRCSALILLAGPKGRIRDLFVRSTSRHFLYLMAETLRFGAAGAKPSSSGVFATHTVAVHAGPSLRHLTHIHIPHAKASSPPETFPPYSNQVS